jgi:hypothetical protein
MQSSTPTSTSSFCTEKGCKGKGNVKISRAGTSRAAAQYAYLFYGPGDKEFALDSRLKYNNFVVHKQHLSCDKKGKGRWTWVIHSFPRKLASFRICTDLQI